VSDSTDRRAAQKARTRTRILTVARELFAAEGFDPVTVVDIAGAAEVSVQTMFNHFVSKEELFFADRAGWVEGPAKAVRTRAADVEPTTALRRYLVGTVEDYVRAGADPQFRRMIEVLESTPALLTFERSLHEETVALLAAELRLAWGPARPASGPASPAVLADITAAVWMAGVRSIVLSMRSPLPADGDEDTIRAASALTERVLGEMERSLLSATPAAALIPPVARAS
jgi:AcrR family transcriptional regulator